MEEVQRGQVQWKERTESCLKKCFLQCCIVSKEALVFGAHGFMCGTTLALTGVVVFLEGNENKLVASMLDGQTVLHSIFVFPLVGTMIGTTYGGLSGLMTLMRARRIED